MDLHGKDASFNRWRVILYYAPHQGKTHFEPTEESEKIESKRPLSDYQLKLYDLLLKYQVISPDELATAIKSGQTIEELIDLEERVKEQELIDKMPEGFTT